MKSGKIFVLPVVLIIALAAWYGTSSIKRRNVLAEPTSAASLQPANRSLESSRSHSQKITGEILVKRMREWRAITDKELSDRTEIELSALITNANAADFVRGLPPELLQTPVGLRALERWGTLDRMAAVKWLSTRENPTLLQLRNALRGWAVKETGEMHHYLAEIPDGRWKNDLITELGRTALYIRQPQEALNVLRHVATPDENQTWVLQQATREWASHDPEAASEWVSGMKDPTQQNPLIRMVAQGYAVSEPKAAAEWLQESMPKGPDLDAAMADVVSVWAAESSPQEAAAWVAQLSDDSMRHASVKPLVQEWRKLDSHAASTWVKQLPAGAFRDQAQAALEEPPLFTPP